MSAPKTVTAGDSASPGPPQPSEAQALKREAVIKSNVSHTSGSSVQRQVPAMGVPSPSSMPPRGQSPLTVVAQGSSTSRTSSPVPLQATGSDEIKGL